MKTTFNLLTFITAVTLMSTGAVAQEQVTFTKDVAPILQERCQVCHSVGTVAPMPLLTYEQARPWAKAIKQKVLNREMPPWFIDKNVGIQDFSNDISLTDKEIATLVKWVDSGAPQGNPADMPPPRQFPDERAWQIGKPDIIVSLPKDIIVRATGPDWWPDILVDPGLTEDRYVQAVQIIPTKGYQVIHHIRTSLVKSHDESIHSGASDGNVELNTEDMGLFLAEYAIGKGPNVFSNGSGRLIKAGTRINLQFHLHANGTENPVNVVLGLKFYPKGIRPAHAVTTASVGSDGAIDIRPREANVESDGYMTLIKAARILSFQPHMHSRGKAECMEAIFPADRIGQSLRRETLSCARFEFNWMVNYVYADDAAPLLPAGTILHTIMWHDNSAGNRANPDPDAQITTGARTVDEMGHAWLDYYYMSDEDFQKETEERKAKQRSLTSQR
jgi:hypothetical protein